MSGGGYPTVISRAAPGRRVAVEAFNRPMPDLPDVQREGPSPYRGYPVKDWPSVVHKRSGGVPQQKAATRRRNGGVPRVSARNLAAHLPLARRALGLLNPLDKADLAKALVEAVMVQGPAKNKFAHGSNWTQCGTLSLCTLQPDYVHGTINSACVQLGDSCLGGQATPSAEGQHGVIGADVASTIRQLRYWKYNPVQPDRCTYVAMFQRVGTVSNPTPTYLGLMPMLAPQVVYRTWVETMDPFLLPIKTPTQSPEPVPWRLRPHRRPNRFRDPLEQRQVGNTVPGFASPPKTDTTRPENAVAVEVVTGRPPRPAPPGTVPPHAAARPRKGTKEVKVIAQATGAVAKVMNVATEANDFVREVHAALPKHLQAKRNKHVNPRTGQEYTMPPRFDQMALAVYQNIGEVNVGQALTNLVKNQAEDRFFGSIGKHIAKGNRNAGNYLGNRQRTQYTLGPGL